MLHCIIWIIRRPSTGSINKICFRQVNIKSCEPPRSAIRRDGGTPGRGRGRAGNGGVPASARSPVPRRARRGCGSRQENARSRLAGLAAVGEQRAAHRPAVVGLGAPTATWASSMPASRSTSVVSAQPASVTMAASEPAKAVPLSLRFGASGRRGAGRCRHDRRRCRPIACVSGMCWAKKASSGWRDSMGGGRQRAGGCQPSLSDGRWPMPLSVDPSLRAGDRRVRTDASSAARETGRDRRRHRRGPRPALEPARARSARPLARAHLQALLEAARWAPSCFGDQPWRFVCWDRSRDPAGFAAALATLSEGNRVWAQHAACCCSPSPAGLPSQRTAEPLGAVRHRRGQREPGHPGRCARAGGTQMGGFDAAAVTKLCRPAGARDADGDDRDRSSGAGRCVAARSPAHHAKPRRARGWRCQDCLRGRLGAAVRRLSRCDGTPAGAGVDRFLVRAGLFLLLFAGLALLLRAARQRLPDQPYLNGLILVLFLFRSRLHAALSGAALRREQACLRARVARLAAEVRASTRAAGEAAELMTLRALGAVGEFLARVRLTLRRCRCSRRCPSARKRSPGAGRMRARWCASWRHAGADRPDRHLLRSAAPVPRACATTCSARRPAATGADWLANLRARLSTPLTGMGTDFATSLFGLVCSAALGFLELQLFHAQSAVTTRLETLVVTELLPVWQTPALIGREQPVAPRYLRGRRGADQGSFASPACSKPRRATMPGGSRKPSQIAATSAAALERCGWSADPHRTPPR